MLGVTLSKLALGGVARKARSTVHVAGRFIDLHRQTFSPSVQSVQNTLSCRCVSTSRGKVGVQALQDSLRKAISERDNKAARGHGDKLKTFVRVLERTRRVAPQLSGLDASFVRDTLKHLLLLLEKQKPEQETVLLDRGVLSKASELVSHVGTKAGTRSRQASHEIENVLTWQLARAYKVLPHTRAEHSSTFLTSLQKLGFEPKGRNQRRFVWSLVREILSAQDTRAKDVARLLRTLVRWGNHGVLNKHFAEKILGKFYATLLLSTSSMKPTYAAFMFAFISKQEHNFSGDQLNLLVQYSIKHKGQMGDIIEASERINRTINYTFLQELCNHYTASVIGNQVGPDASPCPWSIADLLYSAAKTEISLDSVKAHQLMEMFFDSELPLSGHNDKVELNGEKGGASGGGGRTTKVLAQMIYAIEKLDTTGAFNVDNLIEDFYASSREEEATANELVIVLVAIANQIKSAKAYDIEELVVSFLRQVHACNRQELLPVLQAIVYILMSQVHSDAWINSGEKELARRVAEAVFERFSRYLSSSTTKEVSEMLSTVVEVGFTPRKDSIERCLQSLAESSDCTAIDLVNTMKTLGRMDDTMEIIDKRFVDRIIYLFSSKLDEAQTEDLSNFLHSLANLNFNPQASSTLELLDKIDKLLVER